MKWKHASKIHEITSLDLYQILKLRQDIFIIEQNCLYDDIDNIDIISEHLYLRLDDKVIAYARIVPAGTKFDQPSIGRIVVHKSNRGEGFGREIVLRCINLLNERGVHKVFIEAQSHLQAFYESVGFERISSPYDVDGISHIKMSSDLRNKPER